MSNRRGMNDFLNKKDDTAVENMRKKLMET